MCEVCRWASSLWEGKFVLYLKMNLSREPNPKGAGLLWCSEVQVPSAGCLLRAWRPQVSVRYPAFLSRSEGCQARIWRGISVLPLGGRKAGLALPLFLQLSWLRLWWTELGHRFVRGFGERVGGFEIFIGSHWAIGINSPYLPFCASTSTIQVSLSCSLYSLLNLIFLSLPFSFLYGKCFISYLLEERTVVVLNFFR